MLNGINLRVLLTKAIFLLFILSVNSCSSDDDAKNDDSSENKIDVAVTGNVSKLGISYAHIDGYVNLHLVPFSYSSPKIGIELSMTEDFVSAKQVFSKELEGNRLTVVIDTLNAQTKYYYRTFVKVNGLSYYGEKRSFVTNDFSNITTTGDVSNINFTSAKINCKVDVSAIDRDNEYAIGVIYSLTESLLNPDSISKVYDNDVKGLPRVIKAICPLDSINDMSYNVSLSNLQTGQTYYYCSFTCVGKKYKLGEIKSFTTKSDPMVTVNGTTFSVRYGYWDAIATNDETVMYQFYAYNNKIENWKDPIHHVSVIYSAKSTQVSGLETGTFDSYTVSVGITTANDVKDVAYYAYAGEKGNTGKIKVSKSGDKYTIDVPALNYHTFENEAKTFPGTAFSFTGTLEKMPQDVDVKQFNPHMVGF